MGRGRKHRKRIVKDVEFIDIADRGKAVGRSPEGEIMFVDGPVPGDIADVMALRKRKGVLQGAVVEITSFSKDRVDPKCEHFGTCGGCKWQNFDYKAQLEYKEKTVRSSMSRIAKVEIPDFQPILACEEIFYYRNKMEYTFSNKRWLNEDEIKSDEIFTDNDALGFHRPGAFDKIVDIKTCHLQREPANGIRNAVKAYALENKVSFFDLRKQEGFLRNLTIRTSSTGDIMVILALFHEDVEHREGILNMLAEKFPEITALMYVINGKKNDTIFDQEIIVFKGEDHMIEKLNDVKFKVGPKSFFQTNTQQGVKLYDTVVDFAEFTGDELVYDLYTGLGSIALYVADKCKKVIGVEEIAPAIEDAKKNMAFNNIENAEFLVGDVKDVFDQAFVDKYGQPDIVITDPPRVGMHEKVVQMLLSLAADKIVYVSCNPATQARDLALLSEKYDVLKMRPVDMFPHTHHIENVALLKLRQS